MFGSSGFSYSIDAVREPVGDCFAVGIGRDDCSHIAGFIRHGKLCAADCFARQIVGLDDADLTLGLAVDRMKLRHSIGLDGSFQHNQLARVTFGQSIFLDEVSPSIKVVAAGNAIFISNH